MALVLESLYIAMRIYRANIGGSRKFSVSDSEGKANVKTVNNDRQNLSEFYVFNCLYFGICTVTFDRMAFCLEPLVINTPYCTLSFYPRIN